MFSRVGGKDMGTRFLSYVEAIHGFRHLLTQEDLDRAMSLCTSLKGHLKSRFLVLSDDRILPPYQGNRGKRAHPDENGDEVNVSGKRSHQSSDVHHRSTPGLSSIPAQSSTFTPSASNQQVIGVPVSVINGGAGAQSSLPFGYAFPPVVSGGLVQSVQGVSGVTQIAAPLTYPSVGPSGFVSLPSGAQSQLMTSSMMQYPPPPVAQLQKLAPAGPVEVASKSPAYKVVPSRRRTKAKEKTSKTDKTESSVNPARLTPSRAAKNKSGPKESSGAKDVTSPTEDYESCASADESSTEMVQQ